MSKNLFFLSAILFLARFDATSQTDANVPLHGITIYIDYPDVPAAVTAPQLDSLMNSFYYQETGVQRTFKKYWHEQSRRNIVMKHDIFFFTAPQPSTYYDGLNWQNGILLWKDALEWVITNNPGYNWGALTLNESGGLRSVMVISSKWGPGGVGATHWPNWTLTNGVQVTQIFGSVLRAPWDVSNNMFMTLHESGHASFGLPDTYDTDGSSGGTSFYTLMSGGKNDVEPLGGPFLVQNKWGTAIEKNPGTYTITLRADGDSVVVFRNIHDSLEFFTVEARKQTTMGNSLFPVPLGLLIWHSDTKVNTSNTLENMTPMQHYKHSVEQADGLFELEAPANNGGNAGDIFLPGKSFNTVTTPNSKWWDGTVSGIAITNIQLIGSNHIQFVVTVPNPHAGHYPEILQAGWNLVSATPSQVGYDGAKAFDGDVSTYYHVPAGNNYPRPHELVIDLGQSYTMNEFYYTANKNNVPPWEGRIENYKIYISPDGINWGSAVATGTFFQTGIRQYVLFPNTTGRYLKFSALSSFPGVVNDVRTSVAEINVRGFDLLASIQENDPGNELTLYPNPTSGQVTIEFPTNEAIITVTDLVGRHIHTEQTTKKKSTLQFDDNGVYIVYAKTEQGTLVRKVIVNR